MKNLFGKTLVVLIFMFSLVLLVMSGAIYMTHTNWRAKAEMLTKEVSEATVILDGTGVNPGYRQQAIYLQTAIDDEEMLRDKIAAALTAEVTERKAEYAAYQEEITKQSKEIRQNTITMLKYTLFMLKARITSNDSLVKVQNVRNERIRAMHEYVKNMNQLEDLNQQIKILEKRERSLVEGMKEKK